MHLFKQHEVKDYEAAVGQIPVIDYGPYFAGAPRASNTLLPRSHMPVNASASFTP
jgi:hypothetical protein